MPIEEEIKQYRDKIQELLEIEQTITELLPEQLWDRYQKLQLEIPSDKSVLQKKIKDGKSTVETDGLVFKVSSRTRTQVPQEFMETAAELGHFEQLVDTGVITGLKINEDQLERVDPELAGIYKNLLKQQPYLVLTWPKKADK